jgi:hypothetical protein
MPLFITTALRTQNPARNMYFRESLINGRGNAMNLGERAAVEIKFCYEVRITDKCL